MSARPPQITEQPSHVYHAARFKWLPDGRCRILCGRSPVTCGGLLGYTFSHRYDGQDTMPGSDEEHERAIIDALIKDAVTGPGTYWLVRTPNQGYSREWDGSYRFILGKKGANGKRIQNRDGSPRVRAHGDPFGLSISTSTHQRPISEDVAFGWIPVLPAVMYCRDCGLPMWVPIPPCGPE